MVTSTPTPGSSQPSNGHMTPGVTSLAGCNAKRVLECDTSLQLSLKANSILGGSTWTQSADPKFVKLDSVVTNGEGGAVAAEGEKVTIVLSAFKYFAINCFLSFCP